MKYKHIIWDWNGTLLNDRWLCVEAINQALGKRNLTLLTDETYQDVFRFPVEDYYKRIGFDFDKEPFQIAGDEFVSFYGNNFHRVHLHEDASEVLNHILNKGVSQSILSAGKHDFLIEWIKEHNLNHFFINVLGIDNQYATGKTALGISLINSLEFEPKDVIMVGDTIHDSEVAEAMNIECVLVENGHVNRRRLETTGRKVIANLSEFKDRFL